MMTLFVRIMSFAMASRTMLILRRLLVVGMSRIMILRSK